jgi:hypothetical protein
VRSFSSYDDFVDYLLASGEIDSVDELKPASERSVELYTYMFHRWVRQYSTGCKFAQQRAHHLDIAGWQSLVLWDYPSAEDVESLQSYLMGADDAQAILLCLPFLQSTDDLIRFLDPLVKSDHWYCKEILPPEDEALPADHDPSYVDVGLRWQLPRSRYQSWALFFATFPDQPFTRWSPIPAIALRTHPPSQPKEKGGVDLAQMPPLPKEYELGEEWKAQSRERKHELLAGELVGSARARITFRAPRSMAGHLLGDPDYH